jgi:succinyl-CoA synthetase beta subunit/citryl-CoA synthetase large subunit
LARFTENKIKQLLKEDGFPVNDFYVAKSINQVKEYVNNLDFPIVLKALVPLGKKGKAGGVLFANNLKEAIKNAENLFTMDIRNYPVKKILMEKKVDISKELYLSFTYDRIREAPILMVSSKGGINIEEIGDIYEYPIDTILGLNPFECRTAWIKTGVTGKLLTTLGELTSKFYDFFVKYDAYLLEINPLAITTDNELKIIGTLMGVDDAASFRQKKILNMDQIGTERYWKPLTERERKAIEVNEADPYRGTARYTEMPSGDIGFMCGGGGASLLLFDELLAAGGKPANYSEFGGNPTAEKVYGLCKVILSKPGVKGLFVAQNITNNTQVDLVAEGVVRAIEELGINPDNFPIIVREAGVNEERAKIIFDKYNIEYYSDEITLTEAAEKMVEKMKRFYKYGNTTE